LVDTQQNATLVPTAAIQRNPQGAFVYVVKSDQTAAMQTVTIGTTDGGLAAVQGVNPGDAIAITGFDKLQDGAKVSIQKSPADNNGPANASSNNNATSKSAANDGSNAQAPGNGGNRP
jgi:multidrug efflux system membrane fusion protein